MHNLNSLFYLSAPVTQLFYIYKPGWLSELPAGFESLSAATDGSIFFFSFFYIHPCAEEYWIPISVFPFMAFWCSSWDSGWGCLVNYCWRWFWGAACKWDFKFFVALWQHSPCSVSKWGLAVSVRVSAEISTVLPSGAVCPWSWNGYFPRHYFSCN